MVVVMVVAPFSLIRLRGLLAPGDVGPLGIALLAAIDILIRRLLPALLLLRARLLCFLLLLLPTLLRLLLLLLPALLLLRARLLCLLLLLLPTLLRLLLLLLPALRLLSLLLLTTGRPRLLVAGSGLLGPDRCADAPLALEEKLPLEAAPPRE